MKEQDGEEWTEKDKLSERQMVKKKKKRKKDV